MVKPIMAGSAVVVAVALSAENGVMRNAFDELSRFATRLPVARFPDDHWIAITDCMATAGDTLYPAASDAAWTGWIQFGINGGAPDDPWRITNKAGWMEYDPRNMTHKGYHIPIIEPCNTVSNLAYYRIIPDLCANRAVLSMDDDYINAIIQGFATLGMGSSFMHGSRTRLGGVFDNAPISVIAYQYFQYMTSPLQAGSNNSVIHELSTTPRAYDGRELAKQIHNIPLEFELNDWLSALTKLDGPQYFFTFSAIIVNCLTLVAPDFLADKLIPMLISLFALGSDVEAFILNKYVPAVRAAMANVHLTLGEKEVLMPKFAGTVMKLLWAFTWQEGIFKYKPLYNAEWNVFGAMLIPSVNNLANKLNGFAHPDESIQQSDSIYPGHEWCRVKHTAPHAKWHEISANGLMDLAYLADHVKVVTEVAAHRSGLRVQTDGSDVFVSVSIVEAWMSELQASGGWGENHVVTLAFGHVVSVVVASMDTCGSDESDGNITWMEFVCYLESVGSAGDFVGKLFADISSHQELALSQVHNTPSADAVLV